MRLKNEQVSHIVDTLRRAAGGIPLDICLYGSRVRDELRGGDIDLLVLVGEQDVAKMNDMKFRILADIKKNPVIGQRKIDLRIATERDMHSDPFLTALKDSMVYLMRRSEV